MHREDGCHQCAPPRGGRHGPQHQEQQYRIGRVQRDVREVHPRGQPGKIGRALPRPQHLGVGHQREPGERMPMRREMTLSEGPDDPFAGQASENVPVPVNVIAIVEANEVVAGRLAKDGNHRQEQQPADGRSSVGILPRSGSRHPDLTCGARSPAADRCGNHPLRALKIARLRQSALFASSRHLLCFVSGENRAHGCNLIPGIVR